MLYGGAGADWFWFEANEGVDGIADWEDGVDKIIVGTSIENVNIYNYNGEALIGFTDGTTDSYVLLSGIAPATLDASDFIFA